MQTYYKSLPSTYRVFVSPAYIGTKAGLEEGAGEIYSAGVGVETVI